MLTQAKSVAYLKRTVRQLDYRVIVLESYESPEGCGLRIPSPGVKGSVDILVKEKTVRVTVTHLWGGDSYFKFVSNNRSRIMKEHHTGSLGVFVYDIDRSELLFVARLAVAAMAAQRV